MLVHLEIRNIVLIDRLSLPFSGGLTALTGETGAGKSIVLDALSLIRGERADFGLIRKGEDQASVLAVFELPSAHPVWAILADQGLADSPDEGALHLRRVIAADGKSRAFINDQSVSVTLLKTVGQALIDLHGQFETGALFDPVHYRHLLDRFADVGAATNKVRACFEDWKSAGAVRDRARDEMEKARRDEDYLRAALLDLEKLAPEAGEEARLLERKQLLAARADLAEGLGQVLESIEGENGAGTLLARSARVLGRLQPKFPAKIEGWMGCVDGALEQVRRLSAEIESTLFDSDAGLESLEQVEDRLYDLRAAARRQGCSCEELPAKTNELRALIGAISAGEDQVAALEAACAQAESAYLKAAGALSAARKKAAAALENAVMDELPPLKLGAARFVVEIQPLVPERFGPEGIDSVRFLCAMNPGQEPAPIDKVASGGELSRLMLALKVVVHDDTRVCMIFDEVDSGLGGAVADAMAARLSRLSRQAQVLVVTHAPQVAARADHHLVVSKETKGGRTATLVAALDSDSARREEIARMLSGAAVTDEARAAAQKLIEARAA